MTPSPSIQPTPAPRAIPGTTPRPRSATPPAHAPARPLPAQRLPLALLVLAALGALTAPAPTASAQGDLQAYSSRHYVIHTDMPKDDVVPIGRHMDAVFAHLSKRFASFRARGAVKMPLYLFRDQAGYAQFLAAHGIDASNSGGMFFVRPDAQGLATWTAGRSLSQTFAVLQHEGFHQFAWTFIGHDLPTWINEGLAQYFEDAIIIGRRMHLGMTGARRIEAVAQAIDAARDIPFDDLLDTDDAAWSRTLSTDPQRASLLYAQSWSIVYFLVHGDDERYRRAFERYLVEVSKGQPSSRAFRKAFGVEDLTPLARRWRRYAVEQQPHPLSTAVSRMEFLAAALAFLHERGEPIPADAQALQAELAARRFRLTRRSHGLTSRLDATEPALFTFPTAAGDARSFVLLEPARNDLPPRIDAPGLRPRPTLGWTRDDRGHLLHEIAFE